MLINHPLLKEKVHANCPCHICSNEEGMVSLFFPKKDLIKKMDLPRPVGIVYYLCPLCFPVREPFNFNLARKICSERPSNSQLKKFNLKLIYLEDLTEAGRLHGVESE